MSETHVSRSVEIEKGELDAFSADSEPGDYIENIFKDMEESLTRKALRNGQRLGPFTQETRWPAFTYEKGRWEPLILTVRAKMIGGE